MNNVKKNLTNLKAVYSEILCSNVCFFGNFESKLQVKDLRNLRTSFSNEVNLLRHFKDLDKNIISAFLNQEYELFDKEKNTKVAELFTKEKLYDLLAVKGSKFDSKVAGFESPKNVLNLIKSLDIHSSNVFHTHWFRRFDNEVICFLKIDFDQFIGYRGLINFNELSENEKLNIKIQARGSGTDSMLVKTIKTHYRPTSTLIVMLGQNKKDKIELISAYPGVFGPSMPNIKTQQPQEYDYSKKF